MIFHTHYSHYEIDPDALKIRRLYGKRPATPRQQADGEWQSYLKVSSIVVGQPVFVTLVLRDSGVHSGYLTSTVQSIGETGEEN